MEQQYEQYDRNGNPIPCANGSDAEPCYRRPELTIRTKSGRWLGTICGPCAANLIDAGKAQRSIENPFRIEVED